MKAVSIRVTRTRRALLLFFILIANLSFSQGPDYRFRNPTRIAGTAGQVGAIYRFPGVKPGVDGLVRIKALSGGATLEAIDRTADGFDEAFQPEIKVPGRRDGYIDFQITFVRAGTTTDSIRQREVKVSALDIDGSITGINVLYEYNEINMGGGAFDFNTLSTQLLVLPVGTAFRATNLTGVLFGAAVDTMALDIMYTVRNANVATFSWRTGVNNILGNSNSTRYASLYFKSFAYPNSVLSVPRIIDFKGNSDGKLAMLSWKLDNPVTDLSGNSYRCELQRAGDDNNFITIQEPEQLNADVYYYNGELLSAGRSLYRLKLTSTTGEVRLSNVLSFYKGAGNNAIRDLKIYPTVVSNNQFTINIPAERKQAGTIQLINYAGQVVYEKQVSLTAGTNSVSVRDFNPALNGNFILLATTGGENYRGKIIIQSGTRSFK